MRMKKRILVILFGVGICCAVVFFGYNRNTTQEKVVLLIDGGRRASCREIIVEDCRDECIDYDQDKETLLFVNRKNQIVEKNIAGEEQVMDIEAVDLSQTVSNVQYAPFGEGLYFICGGEIYQYSFKDKAVAKKTDGIDSAWRKTYIWDYLFGKKGIRVGMGFTYDDEDKVSRIFVFRGL